jgi:hypothetical protein
MGGRRKRDAQTRRFADGVSGSPGCEAAKSPSPEDTGPTAFHVLGIGLDSSDVPDPSQGMPFVETAELMSERRGCALERRPCGARSGHTLPFRVFTAGGDGSSDGSGTGEGDDGRGGKLIQLCRHDGEPRDIVCGGVTERFTSLADHFTVARAFGDRRIPEHRRCS